MSSKIDLTPVASIAILTSLYLNFLRQFHVVLLNCKYVTHSTLKLRQTIHFLKGYEIYFNIQIFVSLVVTCTVGVIKVTSYLA